MAKEVDFVTTRKIVFFNQTHNFKIIQIVMIFYYHIKSLGREVFLNKYKRKTTIRKIQVLRIVGCIYVKL